METTTQIGVQLVRDPELALFLIAGFATSYLMMYLAGRMDTVFSGFWYARQTALRDGLKQARKDAIVFGTSAGAPQGAQRMI